MESKFQGNYTKYGRSNLENLHLSFQGSDSYHLALRQTICEILNQVPRQTALDVLSSPYPCCSNPVLKTRIFLLFFGVSK